MYLQAAHSAIHWRYDHISKAARCVVVEFAIDTFVGRDETNSSRQTTRFKDSFWHARNQEQTYHQSPFLVHVICLNQAADTWRENLHLVNVELDDWEFELQANTSRTPAETSHSELSEYLHSLAGHLYRYASELKAIEDIADGISKKHVLVMTSSNNSDEEKACFQRVQNDFCQILSLIRALRDHEVELERKVANALALLFNRINLENDKIMLKSSRAMQDILKATQAETKASYAIAVQAQNLTQEMRKDSLSMKTIAVPGMLFLPGTSFAAILAMPFFDTNPWFNSVARIWVWFALTVPSTGFAFVFYWYFHKVHNTRQVDAEEGYATSESEWGSDSDAVSMVSLRNPIPPPPPDPPHASTSDGGIHS
ncbi:hypothetical protein GLAREA_12284 [Glarea lozoyensis ATCC 20868]|uniref:Magnesium transport protein CorA, transmembrane region n=1 Tax=Glarea lozoyensis (strain ATCC 20868 / MF5171) TaxID=1116229 RepID=S3DYU9_GLAL2|nr:uncharacterized protein GLAREA_12284 [Glarea lozoyensis ATCC 20868]EPE31528.1 hypothetical protein GLAREA_12284 [Glarea lozoyensis ATCC 20868]